MKKWLKIQSLVTAEEGALFSLTEDGKIVVNNPHKADLELCRLEPVALSSILILFHKLLTLS